MISFEPSDSLPNCVVYSCKMRAGAPLFVLEDEHDACGISIFDEMHDTEILVMHGDVVECSAMVCKRWPDLVASDWQIPCEGSGRFQVVNERKLVVWVSAFEGQGARFFSLLGHELFHVACHIGRRLGIPLKSASEEWYAYHQNFTMNAVIDSIGFNRDEQS